MGRFDSHKLLSICAGAVALGYGVMLVTQLVSHGWIIDAAGHAIIIDFLAPYTAGRLALAGHAVVAYSSSAQHAAEAVVAGRNFTGRLGWPYPPQYFLVLAPLACLTYLRAFLVWCLVTMSAYAATIGAVAGRRAALLAIAAPWCLIVLIVGQNGFLTAALIGLALLTLERRPIISAFLITLLTYKPQFGLLIPIALVAGGYWRTMAAAAAMVFFLAIVSGTLFGFETFGAFLNVLPATTSDLLEHGGVGWGKLQSIYGFVRWIGMSNTAAWIAQAIFSAALAVGTAVLWRSKSSLSVKAAGLAAAAVLVTPYVFLYDLPVLAVSIAFLSRERALDRVEIGAVVAATGVYVSAMFQPVSLAWIGGLTLVVICGRRSLLDRGCWFGAATAKECA